MIFPKLFLNKNTASYGVMCITLLRLPLIVTNVILACVACANIKQNKWVNVLSILQKQKQHVK